MLELRARQRRNFIATLMLSEGVPLLLGGDEFARSQGGNNNAYCQDNELSWFDWKAVAANIDLVEFTARLCRLREQHPVFRRRQFFTGTPVARVRSRRSRLVSPRRHADGSGQDWGASYARAVTMALSGATGDDAHPDDPFLMMFNAWWEPIDFSVPESLRSLGWQVEIDTADPEAAGRVVDTSSAVPVTERSLVALRGIQPVT